MWKPTAKSDRARINFERSISSQLVTSLEWGELPLVLG